MSHLQQAFGAAAAQDRAVQAMLTACLYSGDETIRDLGKQLAT